MNFIVHPYTISAKAPATQSCYKLVNKIGQSEPLKEKDLKANILSEVKTFFSKEKNMKTLHPEDPKEMDLETLLEFPKEAIPKTLRICDKNGQKGERN